MPLAVTSAGGVPRPRRRRAWRPAPSADQSRSPPPPAISARKRSAIRLASGIGTCRVSRRAQGEPHILVPELGLEACRLKALLGDERAIGLVDRRAEQRVGENVEKLCAVDPGLATSAIASLNASITEAIRKLPLSLTRLALVRFARWGRCAGRAHRTEAGTGRDRLRFAGRDDEQLGGRSGFGPPEHRRGDEAPGLSRDVRHRAARRAPR